MGFSWIAIRKAPRLAPLRTRDRQSEKRNVVSIMLFAFECTLQTAVDTAPAKWPHRTVSRAWLRLAAIALGEMTKTILESISRI